MANNDDSEHRFVSHGGRLRSNEIETIIKVKGFERGVVEVLKLMCDRVNTLGKENIEIAQNLTSIADTLNKIVDAVGMQNAKIMDLMLDKKVSNIHPDNKDVN